MSTASRIDTAPAPSSDERANDILSPEALDFIAELHGRFEPRRQELLAARRKRAEALQAGGTLDFLEETREIREGDWQVAPPADDYLDRRAEITGPSWVAGSKGSPMRMAFVFAFSFSTNSSFTSAIFRSKLLIGPFELPNSAWVSSMKS